MNPEILKEVITNILTVTPRKPFLCLPVSASLYAILKDAYNIETKLITGNLLYKGSYIFKQDYKISEVKNETLQEWAGHAWVEIEGNVCDLSFFRTLYSEQFTKPFKQELISYFGEGRGSLFASPQQLNAMGLTYKAIEYLSDDLATGIIKGFEPLLKAHNDKNS